jgi:hypothetical protein
VITIIKKWNNNIQTVLKNFWVISYVSDTLHYAQAETKDVSEIQELKIC